MTRISKADILQSVRGALYSLPLNVLMLVLFIGATRIIDSTSSTALTTIDNPNNFSLVVRLVLFIPPAIFCAVMAAVRRTQQEKRLFWLVAMIFQIILLVFIRPDFDM